VERSKRDVKLSVVGLNHDVKELARELAAVKERD